MHTLYLAKSILLKHRLQLQHNSCSASLHVCIFTSLTAFLSSNIQSSQVQLYCLNTLRNVPCSPPLANLPIQLSMAGTESLVLSLYSVAQVFVCRKSTSRKSFLPGRHHISNLNYFCLRMKNHHSINSTWGGVKQKLQIKHRLSLETYCLHFFSLFLRGISWKKKQNTRLEGEWINRAAVWGRSKVIKIHSCVHRHSTPTSNADELCQLELHNEIFSLHKTPKSEAALEKFTLVTTLSPEGRTAKQSESSQECTCHCRPLDRRHGLGFSFSQHQLLLHQECYHHTAVDFYPSSLFPWFIIKFYTNLQKGSKVNEWLPIKSRHIQHEKDKTTNSPKNKKIIESTYNSSMIIACHIIKQSLKHPRLTQYISSNSQC